CGRRDLAPYGIAPWRTSPRGLLAKFDALRQRQLRAVVDGAGGAAHVLLPAIGAAFAATAGLLLAAKGTADLRAAGADIHPHEAAVGASGAGEEVGFADVACEDGGREPLRNLVVQFDCF